MTVKAHNAADLLASALQASWAGDDACVEAFLRQVSGFALEASLSGLDLEDQLVVVVPHDHDAAHVPALIRELRRLAPDYGVHQARLAAVRPATGDRCGTATLQLALLSTPERYRRLLADLQDALWMLGHAVRQGTASS